MKLHKVLLKAVGDIVYQTIFESAYADKLLAKATEENPKWGRRDRSFVVETTQDVLRHYRYLTYLSNQDYKNADISMWQVLGAWCIMNGYELPVWDELANVDVAQVQQRLQTNPSPAEKLSVPDWLYDLGHEKLHNRWDTELAAMNQPAKLVIRVNTLKTTVAKLAAILLAQEIPTEPIPNVPDALVVVTRKYLMKLPEFIEGLFEIQDASSQLVAPLLDAQPGMTVIDACAGGGGKTLHLATLMKNKGHIIACDVEAIKLKSLNARLQRAGYHNTEAKLITPAVVANYKHKADRLLLDVPCSGLGVLKRNPDTKWQLSPEAITEVANIQRQILTDYHTMLKPGGKMVYATCSILPQEDEQQVQWFIRQHPEYELVEQHYIWPSQFGFDGFYMALLKKN